MTRQSENELSISASNLRVRYPNGVSLSFGDFSLPGGVVALIGHNGAGKSTLLKTILGLLPPKEGQIKATIRNKEEEIVLRPERDMAFCPENGAVFADISVESYIKLWCRIKKGDANYFRKGGSRYVEMLKVAPLLKRLGRELSKGQRRRVQTLVSFLISPRLLIMDEPFSGLDVQRTHELSEVIRECRSKICFILATHRMDVVERLADTVMVLEGGRVLTHGSVSEVSLALCPEPVISNEPEKCSQPEQHAPSLLDALTYYLRLQASQMSMAGCEG